MSKDNFHSNDFSSSIGFIIACVGSAVGLGNLWKFPYITYENGGGAFVLVYLLSIMLVGLPLLLSEIMIGKSGKQNVYATFKTLSNNNQFWKIVGGLALLTSFVILSYYSVVAGWTLEYFISSLGSNLKVFTSETIGDHFSSFVGNGSKQVIFHTIFMFLTGAIVYLGTQGIEKAVKVLMPLLFLFVVIIMAISLSNYGFSDSFNFLFHFDFSKLKASSILEALGHAFFTLSLGMGVMIIYGSYLPKNVNIIRASLYIMFFDTLMAIMACFMIYPIIFGTGLKMNESSSMLFTALTVQFNALPMGEYISALFYLLVAFAALTSTISLLEPIVSFISEEFKINRKKATLLSALFVWAFGILSALSNGANELLTKVSFFDKADHLASNWGLTLGGICVSIFVGYKLSSKTHLQELKIEKKSLFYSYFLTCVKFITPVFILLIILTKIGVF